MYSKTQNKNFLVEEIRRFLSANGSPLLPDLAMDFHPRSIHFCIKINQKSEAELISFERESKTLQIRFGNKIFLSRIQDST